MTLLQDLDSVDAVHSRQTDIRQHDIRNVMTDPRDRFLHRTERAGAGKAWREVDQRRQRIAKILLILDDRRSDRFVSRRFHSSKILVHWPAIVPPPRG